MNASQSRSPEIAKSENVVYVNVTNRGQRKERNRLPNLTLSTNDLRYATEAPLLRWQTIAPALEELK